MLIRAIVLWQRLRQWKSKYFFFNKHKLNVSVTVHIHRIVARWPNKRWLSHRIGLFQVVMMLQFLNDVANDVESTQKSIITS